MTTTPTRPLHFETPLRGDAAVDRTFTDIAAFVDIMAAHDTANGPSLGMLAANIVTRLLDHYDGYLIVDRHANGYDTQTLPDCAWTTVVRVADPANGGTVDVSFALDPHVGDLHFAANEVTPGSIPGKSATFVMRRADRIKRQSIQYINDLVDAAAS